VGGGGNAMMMMMKIDEISNIWERNKTNASTREGGGWGWGGEKMRMGRFHLPVHSQ